MQRLRAARAVLLILALGLLLWGPRIFPCLGCFWNGFEWVQPVPKSFTTSPCSDCRGKGTVTGVEWVVVRFWDKPFEDPHFVLVDPFSDHQQFKEGSFSEHVRLAISRSGVNLEFWWPYRPSIRLTTREIFLYLEIVLLVLLAGFGPLFRCSACPLCWGTGTISAYRRWTPEAWSPRLRKAGKAALIAVPIAVVPFMFAQVPYGDCLRCPEIQRENQEARDVLTVCPRCNGQGQYGLWARLFLRDD